MVESKEGIKLNAVPLKSSKNQLTVDQVKMIEEAISVIGEYGEVRLVVNHGRLHYLITQKSFNARSYRPGMIVDEYK